MNNCKQCQAVIGKGAVLVGRLANLVGAHRTQYGRGELPLVMEIMSAELDRVKRRLTKTASEMLPRGR